MHEEPEKTIERIMMRIVSNAIPVGWRSQSVLPGAGERKSFSRGSNGYDVAARVEYDPSEHEPRDIDWFATAQTGGQTVYVTEYQEPREINVFVLVDVSKTMEFGTARVTKRELAAELAACIIESAKETNDKVGVIVFTDNGIPAHLMPASGNAQMIPALLSIINADSGQRDGETSGLASALNLLPSTKALVYVISDFLSLNDEEKTALEHAGYAHDVTCIVVQDRRERELPAPTGWWPEHLQLEDISTGKRVGIWLTKKNRRLFAETAQRQTEALLALLKGANCDRAVFSTEEGEAAIPRIMQLFSEHRS